MNELLHMFCFSFEGETKVNSLLRDSAKQHEEEATSLSNMLSFSLPS